MKMILAPHLCLFWHRDVDFTIFFQSFAQPSPLWDIILQYKRDYSSGHFLVFLCALLPTLFLILILSYPFLFSVLTSF